MFFVESWCTEGLRICDIWISIFCICCADADACESHKIPVTLVKLVVYYYVDFDQYDPCELNGLIWMGIQAVHLTLQFNDSPDITHKTI